MRENAFLMLVTLCLTGCSRAPASTACANDRTTVLELLKSDKTASANLHRADALVTQGQAGACPALIETSVLPVLDKAIVTAKSAPVTTPWGQARRAELVTLMEHRREGARRYVAALLSDEISQVVEQMQSQRDIERRALDVESKIQAQAGAFEPCSP